MSTETSSTLSDVMKEYYIRELLDRLQPALVHEQFGQKGETIKLPRNAGKIAEWRRYGALAPATTALTEGTTPAGSNHSVTKVQATVQQFGDFTTVSDVLQMQAVDPVLEEFTRVFGEQAGTTLDQKCRDILAAGTNVQYADSVADRASVASTNEFGSDEIARAVNVLERNDVPKILFPNGPAYAGIIHPDTAAGLRQDPGWVELQVAQGGAGLATGAVGLLGGVLWTATSNAKIFAAAGSGGIDVYGSLVLGANAFGKAAYDGQDMVDFIVQALGSGGTADPLRQRSSVGWLVSAVWKILEQARICRIEHARADLT